jgi:Ca2+-binding RTX toxin-like protein
MGQAGADAMAGGAGDDAYVVGAGDTVSEQPGAGTDTVLSAAAFTLSPNLENLILTGSAAVAGTGNGLGNQLTGNAAANVLTGFGGDDVLNGKGGTDRMLRGAGNDVYGVDRAGDVVPEAPARKPTWCGARSPTRWRRYGDSGPAGVGGDGDWRRA